MKYISAVRVMVLISILCVVALLSYFVVRSHRTNTDQKMAQVLLLQSTLESHGAFSHYEAARITVMAANAANGVKPHDNDIAWIVAELNAHAQSEASLDIKRRMVILMMIRAITTQVGMLDSQSNRQLFDGVSKCLTRSPLESGRAVWVLGGLRDPRVVLLLTPLKTSPDIYIRKNVEQALQEQNSMR